jgi:hypothetical protein
MTVQLHICSDHSISGNGFVIYFSFKPGYSIRFQGTVFCACCSVYVLHGPHQASPYVNIKACTGLDFRPCFPPDSLS